MSTSRTRPATLLPISKPTSHSPTSSDMSDDPVVLTPSSPRPGTGGTAPLIGEHTICGNDRVESRLGVQLNTHGNEEGNPVEESYVTQLRNLARVFLQGEPSAEDLEANLSLELLGFYEEDLKKRQCIVDDVYVGQITHLLERIAVAQDLRQCTPKPARIDLLHLLLGSYKNQFKTIVQLVGALKATLVMAEKQGEAFTCREASLYSAITKLEKQLIVSEKENVKLTREIDGLVDENRLRGGGLSDELVAFNNSYTVLMERNDTLEKENTFLKEKIGTLKVELELQRKLGRENIWLRHKNASLMKGQHVRKMHQKVDKLKEQTRKLRETVDYLEKGGRALKEAVDNDNLEKENKELEEEDGVPLESLSAVVENISTVC